MSYPFHVADRELQLSASIGIVVPDAATMSADEVMRAAELALYEAKAGGRGGARIFETDRYPTLLDEVKLARELSNALVLSELRVHYEPVFDLRTDGLHGFDATVQWDHPRRGMLSAADFEDVAAGTGAEIAIGEMTLRDACAAAASWLPPAGGGASPIVSVPLSSRQLHRPGLVDFVRRALERASLAPASLVLEIDDGALSGEAGRAMENMRTLRVAGIRIALRNFGAGPTPLSALRLLPLDILKLDPTLTNAIDEGDAARVLAESTVAIGHSLGLRVGATGIERRDQVELLRKAGCDTAQGPFFARATDADGVRRMLERRPLAMLAG
jgi:EAL domain-containing protein (putative c-di-GMP-specific phosphodiesterase class I)